MSAGESLAFRLWVAINECRQASSLGNKRSWSRWEWQRRETVASKVMKRKKIARKLNQNDIIVSNEVYDYFFWLCQILLHCENQPQVELGCLSWFQQYPFWFLVAC